jgi:hypothetical protein
MLADSLSRFDCVAFDTHTRELATKHRLSAIVTVSYGTRKSGKRIHTRIYAYGLLSTSVLVIHISKNIDDAISSFKKSASERVHTVYKTVGNLTPFVVWIETLK